MPRTYDPAFRIGAGITLRSNEIPGRYASDLVRSGTEREPILRHGA
jgi:hypothetical protein